MNLPHIVTRELPTAGGSYATGGLVEGTDFLNLPKLIDQGYLRAAKTAAELKLPAAELIPFEGAAPPIPKKKTEVAAPETAANTSRKRGGRA
jgi:hypothetical protein